MIGKPTSGNGIRQRFATSRAGSGMGKGFTFTLSIVLLSLTLIAVASYATEWRKSQQVSFTEILPSETMRLQERVGADMGQMAQADASVKKDNSTTTLSVSTSAPFKREGEPLAKLSDYTESLPANLRNLGYEAVLDTNSMGGSNSTVIVTSGNGSLVHSNDGAYDITTFNLPSGITPDAIYATISCGKQASSVGDITSIGSAGSGYGLYYVVNYTEPGGRNYLRNYYAPPNSNVSLRVVYPDDTLLYFESRMGPGGQNRTSIHYTKSSGGALILPFGDNSSGVVRDYSLFRQNVTLAAGSSAPSWKADCSRGGCYYFDGTGKYMSVPGGVELTDAEIPLPLGGEKIYDPWFESFSSLSCSTDSECGFDDQKTDTWYYWTNVGADQYNYFDATKSQAQSYIGLHAFTEQENSVANIYAQADHLQPSTTYTLTFWSKEDAGRYKIELSDGKCLTQAGDWGTPPCAYFTTLPSSAYARTTKEFTTPPGSSMLTAFIRLFPGASANSDVYYDSVSLKQSSGMNGGFENYYPEGSTIYPQ